MLFAGVLKRAITADALAIIDGQRHTHRVGRGEPWVVLWRRRARSQGHFPGR
jgi:hypothetical protein